jgi:hypothetical protein
MPKALHYAKFFSTYLAQPIDENHQGDIDLDCPFEECLKEEHFKANCNTGEWHCVRCDAGGNARTLLTMLHEQYLTHTTPAQYSYLSEVRGISAQLLEDAGFAYDPDNDRWLVPYYSYNPVTETWSEFLNNLGYFYPSSENPKSQFVIKKATGLPLYLYNPGLHQYPPSDTAIICEGEWDTLAYLDAHPDTEDMILGKPGAGFNAAYLKTLSKIKNVHLLLDNDVPGRKQTAVCIKTLQTGKFNISTLDWTLVPDAPKDVRDLWIDRPEEMSEQIETAMVPYEEGNSTPTEDFGVSAGYAADISIYDTITSFDDYLAKMKEFLYLTPTTTAAMAATLGITASIDIPGEPLWAFLIGPGSSGKTTFIESFGGTNQRFDNLSKITSKSLISGWKDDSGDEPSYLQKLRHKTLFVKDFTVTLMDTPDEQKEVFGLLTDIFDGYVKIPYGNNQVKEFHNIYFNMVAGVTDIVHQHSSASIGERFLRIDYLGRDYNSRAFAEQALRNFGKSKKQKEDLTKATLGFVNHLTSLPISLDIPDSYFTAITDLAEFIALLRTKVESDRIEGIRYRPRAELPSRIALTLAKLLAGIRLVFNEDPESEEETLRATIPAFKIVQKVALDTCYGFPLDILRFIASHPMASRDDIVHGTKIHAQRAYRVLTDLVTTEVLHYAKGMPGAKGGNTRKHYAVNPKLLAALTQDPYNEVTRFKPSKRRKR